MQTAHKLKILESLQTKADLINLEEKLNILSDVFGKISTNYEQTIKQNLDFITFNKLKEDFQILNFSLNSQANLETYLNQVEEAIKKIKILKLTVATAPTQATIDEIYYWINNTLGLDVLLDLSINSSIIGGLLIEFDGKYKDYSLKPKLDDFLEANLN